MRAFLPGLLLLAPFAASAQAPDDDDAQAHARDAAEVRALNAAVKQRSDAKLGADAKAQADYARDRAAYEAAMAENGRARDEAAAAQAAYLAAGRQHDADLAAWRADLGRREDRCDAIAAAAARREAQARPRAAQCQDEVVTGSRISRARTCR